MTPEYFFLIYAVPSLRNCGYRLEESKISELERQAVTGESLPFNELKTLLPKAFKRVAALYGEKDDYTLDEVRHYWWVEHQRIIDAREEGYENEPDHINEICKVRFPTVVHKVDGARYAVRFENGEVLKLTNYRGLELQPGDRVTTHVTDIVEKIEESFYQRYFKEIPRP